MRLFVGIELPEDVRAGLSALAGGIPGARWVPAENIHLSLRFIGEVQADEAGDIDAVLQAVGGPAFALRFSDLGCFDRRGRVHAVWVGFQRSDPLTRLQAKVESALVRAGLEPEHRKFKPHVTLARMKNGDAGAVGRYLESQDRVSAPPVVVDRFTLFQSHLGGDGARYEALEDYPLED